VAAWPFKLYIKKARPHLPIPSLETTRSQEQTLFITAFEERDDWNIYTLNSHPNPISVMDPNPRRIKVVGSEVRV
jgi:hypothetical protein